MADITVISVIECHETQCGITSTVQGAHAHCPVCAGSNITLKN